LASDIRCVESTPQRVTSLRTVLREFLLALDDHNEFVAQMLERCTLGPHVGSTTLLIPLTRLPEQPR
jgi:hypothetical protein